MEIKIGKVISQLRTMKGLNQRDFAKILGVSNGAIGMWETGKRQPDLETIKRIASFFDVSTDFLLGMEESRVNNDVLNDTKFELDCEKADKIADIINTFTSLRPEFQDCALEQIRKLSELQNKI